MKKTVTIAISIPIEIAAEADELTKVLNISRSALLTAVISFMFKWMKQGGGIDGIKTEILNR